MLESIWLFIMVCIAALCAWRHVHMEIEEYDDEVLAQIQWLGASLGAMLIGLYLSWGGLGSVFLRWLQASLPQAGTDIANFTAYAIVGTCGLGLVAGLPFGFVMLFFFLNDRVKDQSEEDASLGKRPATIMQFPKR